MGNMQRTRSGREPGARGRSQLAGAASRALAWLAGVDGDEDLELLEDEPGGGDPLWQLIGEQAADPVMRPAVGPQAAELTSRSTFAAQAVEPAPRAAFIAQAMDPAAQAPFVAQAADPMPAAREPTPDLGARFPLAARGYNRAAVDEHVLALERELAAMRARSNGAPASVSDELARIGEQTTSILVVAQDKANETTRLAREEAERCLADAAAGAVSITARAQARLHELDAETDSVWRERERLLDDVRTVSAALMELAKDASERFPAEAAPDDWPAAQPPAAQPPADQPTQEWSFEAHEGLAEGWPAPEAPDPGLGEWPPEPPEQRPGEWPPAD